MSCLDVNYDYVFNNEVTSNEIIPFNLRAYFVFLEHIFIFIEHFLSA